MKPAKSLTEVDRTYASLIVTKDCAIGPCFVKNLIKAFLDPRGYVLPEKSLFHLLLRAREAFRAEGNLLRLTYPTTMTIVGDIHGQFRDLVTILDLNSWDSDQLGFIFDGDFVDRGDKCARCC